MARIRTIKPEFWTDEKIVSLSPTARLLFIGLWNFCDDDGRMEFSPIRIKLQILPLDPTDLSAELGELRRDLVDVYQVAGKQYLQVRNFAKHQKVDKRTRSKLPAPPPNPTEPRRPPPSPPDGMEGNGREKEGKGNDAPPTPSPPPPTSDDEFKPSQLERSMTTHPRLEEVCRKFEEKWPHFARQRRQHVIEWLADGAVPEEDIYPTIEHVWSVKQHDVGGYAFFDRQVRSCIAVRKDREEINKRMEAKYGAVSEG